MKRNKAVAFFIGLAVGLAPFVLFAEKTASKTFTIAAPASSSTQSATTQKDNAAQAKAGTPVRPAIQIKKMKGKVKFADPMKNSFKLIPDNVGDPLEITCETNSADCSVSGLVVDMDAEAEVYFENNKWRAKSVK